jgi:hypothetical protein
MLPPVPPPCIINLGPRAPPAAWAALARITNSTPSNVQVCGATSTPAQWQEGYRRSRRHGGCLAHLCVRGGRRQRRQDVMNSSAVFVDVVSYFAVFRLMDETPFDSRKLRGVILAESGSNAPTHLDNHECWVPWPVGLEFDHPHAPAAAAQRGT